MPLAKMQDDKMNLVRKKGDPDIRVENYQNYRKKEQGLREEKKITQEAQRFLPIFRTKSRSNLYAPVT